MPSERYHYFNGRDIPESLMLPPLFPTTSAASSAKATMATASSPPKATAPCNHHTESIEVLLPSSPIRTMDVYLLTDDDHIQHVRSPTEENGVVSCFYISDDEEDNDFYYSRDVRASGASTGMSVSSFGSSSTDDNHAYFSAPSDEAVRIPGAVHTATRSSSSDNDTLVPRVLTYSYSKDCGEKRGSTEERDGIDEQNGDADDDDSLLGLGCLSDSLCMSMGGLLSNTAGPHFLAATNHQHLTTIMGN